MTGSGTVLDRGITGLADFMERNQGQVVTVRLAQPDIGFVRFAARIRGLHFEPIENAERAAVWLKQAEGKLAIYDVQPIGDREEKLIERQVYKAARSGS